MFSSSLLHTNIHFLSPSFHPHSFSFSSDTDGWEWRFSARRIDNVNLCLATVQPRGRHGLTARTPKIWCQQMQRRSNDKNKNSWRTSKPSNSSMFLSEGEILSSEKEIIISTNSHIKTKRKKKTSHTLTEVKSLLCRAIKQAAGLTKDSVTTVDQ